ncbi:MAG: hypothetical protein KJN67_06030 [Pontiella sp.]|nr:hypothetical protein [Pontiella sp.]
MKKIITMSIAAGLVAVASAQVSVTMDFASAYVYRGATFLDGASFQPGIEASGFGLAEEYGSVSAGAWGSVDLDNENGNSSNFQEIDFYASYGLPTLIEGLDLSVGYCEYFYGAGADGSDKEFSFGAGGEVAGVALGVGLYKGVGGAIDTQLYAEFSAGYDLEVTEEVAGSLSANLGYVDPSAAGSESGFSHYDITVGVGGALSETWSWGVSGTYIGEIDDEVLATDVDFVGMFSLACDM